MRGPVSSELERARFDEGALAFFLGRIGRGP